MRLPRPWIALVLVVAAGCGDDEPEVNWGSHVAVFDAAMAALSRADLEGLWPYLTPAGKAQVEKDLLSLQVQLRDDEERDRLLRSLALQTEVPVAELERARTGTLGDVWRFYLKAKPRPPNPRKGMIRIEPDGRRAAIGYVDAQGTERVVVLSLTGGRWRIEVLPL